MTPERKQATGTSGMVATAFPSASEAAVEILRCGGNAIDAAVAAAWALSACEPSASGLGGQTTLLIRLADGRTVVVDGHSRAPASASKQCISPSQQQRGYRACTVPSTPATLEFAQTRYGILPRAEVMAPAIRLAQDGYPITRLQRRQAKWCQNALLASPAAGRLFLSQGRPFHVGEILRQPELADTLCRLADLGAEDFYRGRIAQAIADDMRRNGGLMTEKDLAEHEGPRECEPLTSSYREHQVVSVPPPGGGLQVLLGLKILEHFAPGELAPPGDRWYETMAEVVYAAFRERKHLMPTPGDSTGTLAASYLRDARISEIACRIQAGCRAETVEADPEEPGETTHLCTADGRGNVVALTQSIQSLFGAKVAHGQLGFLYNNYLSTCKRRPHPHQLGSRCIPLSNAAPTLVLQRPPTRSEEQGGNTRSAREPVLALGAAGSRRIVSAILHVINATLDHGLPLEEAVSLPRVHGMLSRNVYLERPAATEPLRERLARRFRKVTIKAAHSFSMGAVQAIQFPENRALVGVADPRRDGVALGL